MARAHVDPGKVIAHRDAAQISGWKYICSAMNGSNNPFAVRNNRTTLCSPLPMNTLATNRVATLMKL